MKRKNQNFRKAGTLLGVLVLSLGIAIAATDDDRDGSRKEKSHDDPGDRQKGDRGEHGGDHHGEHGDYTDEKGKDRGGHGGDHQADRGGYGDDHSKGHDGDRGDNHGKGYDGDHRGDYGDDHGKGHDGGHHDKGHDGGHRGDRGEDHGKGHDGDHRGDRGDDHGKGHDGGHRGDRGDYGDDHNKGHGERGGHDGGHRGDRGDYGGDHNKGHGGHDGGHRGDKHGGHGDYHAEFRTKRGRVYRDCQVLSHDDYGIMIRHSGGAARLAFGDLSNSVQQRYNYNSSAAANYVQNYAPVRGSQIAHDRALATHFRGFSPQYAATRAHLAFAGGLLAAPFVGSLGVPGVRSFDAWQADSYFARINPYHSSHRYKVKDGNVHLSNRRQCDRFDVGNHYQYAYRPSYLNPNSYLHHGARYGNHIAPAMNGGHITATNGANPIAPAMMSYSQFQQARARAIRNVTPRVTPGRAYVPGGGGKR